MINVGKFYKFFYVIVSFVIGNRLSNQLEILG
jgi:hypothetical protein